ncbi:MAG TPA: SDR family oxidoreductase [Usitatibacter sp.]|jgi:NAD(P)-dependent dehydrogenase (short-subunit alcohol dehydrogenase family)|nr:SDR family oxidoreductase [Usitatibacter sp.]
MNVTGFAPAHRLDGRTVVIAGGLGAVGRATAIRLAATGARIVLLHRKGAAEAEAFVSTLPGTGHFDVRASILDSPALAAAAAEVQASAPAVHVLVNTAGFTKPVPIGDLDALDDALIDEIFASNWRGVFATIRAFRGLLDESGDGLIVNVSSIAALSGTGSNLAYSAAKAGVDVMGKALARALAPKIRVLTVSPGVVDSAFVPGRGADFNAKAAATTPLRRIGTPDDVAAAIEACATTLRFATGQVLVVDGGRSL